MHPHAPSNPMFEHNVAQCLITSSSSYTKNSRLTYSGRCGVQNSSNEDRLDACYESGSQGKQGMSADNTIRVPYSAKHHSTHDMMEGARIDHHIVMAYELLFS